MFLQFPGYDLQLKIMDGFITFHPFISIIPMKKPDNIIEFLQFSTQTPDFQSSQLRRLMQVMKKLSHPNIIRCYGYFWDYPSQSLYIAPLAEKNYRCSSQQ